MEATPGTVRSYIRTMATKIRLYKLICDRSVSSRVAVRSFFSGRLLGQHRPLRRCRHGSRRESATICVTPRSTLPCELGMNPAKLGRIPSGRFRDFGRLIRRRRQVAESSHLALAPLTSADLPTGSTDLWARAAELARHVFLRHELCVWITRA